MVFVMSGPLNGVRHSPDQGFDPQKNARFRGKPLNELTREEALEALDQALREVYELHRRLGLL